MVDLEEQRGQREQAAAKKKEEAGQFGRDVLLGVVLICALTYLAGRIVRIVFEYFPQLCTGWTRFPVEIGIPLLILFPVSFLFRRWRRKVAIKA